MGRTVTYSLSRDDGIVKGSITVGKERYWNEMSMDDGRQFITDDQYEMDPFSGQALLESLPEYPASHTVPQPYLMVCKLIIM